MDGGVDSPQSTYAFGLRQTYLTFESVLDVQGSAAAVAKEAELNRPSCITTDEAGAVDLSSTPPFDMRGLILPKPLPLRQGWGKEEGASDGAVVFPLIMHQRVRTCTHVRFEMVGGICWSIQSSHPDVTTHIHT